MKKIANFIFHHFFEIILSIPNSAFFNFRVLPFKYAIRFPFFVSFHIRCKGINKNTFIVHNCNLNTASMRIGFGDSPNAFNRTKKGLISISNNGRIELEGRIGLSKGCMIIVDNATLKIGDNFRSNHTLCIDIANSDVTIGKNVVLGWDVTIRNDDGHYIVNDGIQSQKSLPISIGNNVWICANTTILKGCSLGNGCVLAYGSVLTKANNEENVLYAGYPARIIKENISWIE